MNKEWSDRNKNMQLLLRKKDTFAAGINECIGLREELFSTITKLFGSLSDEQLCLMPFPNAKGYHSKTIAYSVWHIFRIEDITAHTLICKDEQVLFRGNHFKRTGSPIITTGNELVGKEIADFSKKLDKNELFNYATAVKQSTDSILRSLSYQDTKRKFDNEDKERIVASKCVSDDENAVWLIDYWCGKDVAGIIRMPFTRHLIMHIEAMMRIAGKIGIKI